MNIYRVMYIIVSWYPFYHVPIPATLDFHAYYLEHIVSKIVILETMVGKLRNQIPRPLFSQIMVVVVIYNISRASITSFAIEHPLRPSDAYVRQ